MLIVCAVIILEKKGHFIVLYKCINAQKIYVKDAKRWHFPQRNVKNDGKP
jgi:hypothetical protein